MKRLLWPAALLLYGCGGHQQSALDAAGRQAAKVENLWWFFFWLLTAIFTAVIIVLALALLRPRSAEYEQELEKTHQPAEERDRRASRTVTVASVASIVILLSLIAVSIATGKSISSLQNAKNGIVVEVTGNQWWWYVRYLNDYANRIVITANEIHIPVGRPVMIRATSNDVIHSFWVPNLHGKVDLIPSRVNTLWLQADHAGRFRGQCAEFCGVQHAHMALWVIAEPQAQFDAWMERQLQPAKQPSNPQQQRGEQVFLNNGCVLCHAIGGTTAAGQVAPDLTHFGSRSTLAAGTLPNTKGNLGGWISDPQNIKPGNHMATVPLRAEELEPLLDYLESLQ